VVTFIDHFSTREFHAVFSLPLGGSPPSRFRQRSSPRQAHPRQLPAATRRLPAIAPKFPGKFRCTDLCSRPKSQVRKKKRQTRWSSLSSAAGIPGCPARSNRVGLAAHSSLRCRKSNGRRAQTARHRPGPVRMSVDDKKAEQPELVRRPSIQLPAATSTSRSTPAPSCMTCLRGWRLCAVATAAAAPVAALVEEIPERPSRLKARSRAD